MAAIVVTVILVAVIAIGMRILKRRGQREAAAGGRPSKTTIDPFTVGEPWRRHVSTAVSTERRYNEIVRGVQPGPTRDRLSTIAGQVHHGVAELFAIAKRGDDLDDAIGRIDAPSISRRLAAATDEGSRGALQSQLDAAGRMRATRDQTDQQLRTMNLRLDELVAQAAEVSVGGGATTELGTALDDLVTQMEALRLAVADVEAVRRGPVLPPLPEGEAPEIAGPAASPADPAAGEAGTATPAT